MIATICFRRVVPIGLLLLGAICIASRSQVAWAQKNTEAPQGPSVSAQFIVGNAADYAGIDRCRSCHKPEFREYEKTPHAKLTVPGKTYVSGCEACHGPGKAHADAVEDAEGDEGKTKRALEEHPIFSF